MKIEIPNDADLPAALAKVMGWTVSRHPMTDQPKPMSVEAAKDAIINASPLGQGIEFCKLANNLIAAVERRERARVLAEFRKLAERWTALFPKGKCEDESTLCIGQLSRLIQSLETPNQKP